jgi:predicted membrane-bound spermidine synthase
MVDSPDYITIYSKELLDINFNSILILGLGLGVQPYVCQDFAQVDVVEIDQNVIDINNQLGFLNENVNIIKDDVFTFTPTKTYDIIVFDIIWNPLTEELTNTLTTKYLPFVNEGGFLYIPINASCESCIKKILK